MNFVNNITNIANYVCINIYLYENKEILKCKNLILGITL